MMMQRTLQPLLNGIKRLLLPIKAAVRARRATSIAPKQHLKAFNRHYWHKKVAEFKLPEPALEIFENAILSRPEFIHSENSLGGAYTENGQHIRSSHHLRRGKIFTQGTPEQLPSDRIAAIQRYLPGHYIYLGCYFNHYGHFLLESLSRVWPLVESEDWRDRKFLYHLHNKEQRPQPGLLRLLERVGIQSEQIYFIHEDTRVELLTIPSQQSVLARAISKEMLALYRQISTPTQEMDESFGEDHRKLYISRRLLPKQRRRAINEHQLEQHFEQKGFRIIHPQFMSTEEQLDCFALAYELAGCEGSGLHNVLFAPNCRKMTLIAPLGRIPDVITQQLINQRAGCHTLALLQGPEAAPGMPSHSLPFWIDDTLIQSDKPAPKAYYHFQLLEITAAIQNRANRKIDTATVMESLRLSPEDELIYLALLTYEKGDLELALEYATLSKAQLQKKPILHYLLAHIYEREKLIEAATKAIHHALALDPDNDAASPLLQLSGLLMQNDPILPEHAIEAANLCLQAANLDPANPEPWFNLAQAYLHQNKPDQAREAINQAIQINPNNIGYMTRLAHIAGRLGDYELGIKTLNWLIKQPAPSANTYLQLSWCLLQAKQSKEAERIARQSINRTPDKTTAYEHLARALIQQDRLNDAIETVDTGLDQSPTHHGLKKLKKKLTGDTSTK